MPRSEWDKLLQGGEYRALQTDALSIAMDSEAPSEGRAHAYWYACVAAYRRENYHGAVQLATAGLSLAKHSGEHSLEARLHCQLGAYCVRIGDLVQAEEHLRAFLAHPFATGDLWRTGMAHYHLGTVHLQRNEHAAAIPEFGQASLLYAQVGDTKRQAEAELAAAWAHLHLGQLDEAAARFASTEEILRTHPDAESEAYLLCYQAQYHRLRGDLPLATACCEQILSGRPGVNANHLAEAAWNAGEVALAGGRIDEARLFADVAYQYALIRLYPLLFNLVGDLRRRIQERAAAAV